jgi:hypothetical protein
LANVDLAVLIDDDLDLPKEIPSQRKGEAMRRSSHKRIYEAGVGVKQKVSELRSGRQARLVAGSNALILKFS